MLTSDLVQARVYKKKVRPRYVDVRDPDYREMAARLIETFEEHVGQKRGALDEALHDILGTDTDFQLHKGFVHLLGKRCEFEEEAPMEPAELRRRVFDAAAEAWSGVSSLEPRLDRDAVLAGVAENLELEPREVDAGLYGDLEDEQVLGKFRRCSPDWLLRRYNVALAQGVLLRATELEIDLAAPSGEERSVPKHRALFRKVKFFQLMHRIRRRDDGGWKVILDGPASLFRAGTKYGFRMAAFLPTLLHFDAWSLVAKVQWGPKRREKIFELDASSGLRSHTRLTGQWRPEELTWLPQQLGELDDAWEVSSDAELSSLGGEGVLVPDYVFVHRPTGVEVVMEIFGFWNKGSIESRLDLLRRHGPENLILAVSSRLATGRGDRRLDALGDELPNEVYVFRTHPVARKVLKIMEGFLP